MNYSFESPKVFDKLLIPADAVAASGHHDFQPAWRGFQHYENNFLKWYAVFSWLSTTITETKMFVSMNWQTFICRKHCRLPSFRMSVCSSRWVCTASGDFFVMKGVVEEFLEKAGMHKIPQYDPNAGQPSLHPGTSGKHHLRRRSDWLSWARFIHRLLDNYGIGEKAYVAVLDMPKIVEKASFDRKYEGIAEISGCEHVTSVWWFRNMYLPVKSKR